jgi:hypothetical protein
MAGSETASTVVSPVSPDALQKRAERFGGVAKEDKTKQDKAAAHKRKIETVLTVEEEEKLKKRAERFGLAPSVGAGHQAAAVTGAAVTGGASQTPVAAPAAVKTGAQ